MKQKQLNLFKSIGYLFVVLGFFILPNAIYGQAFTGTFDFTGANGNVASLSYNGVPITNLTVSPLVKTGVTTSSSSGNSRATGWPTGSTSGVNPAAGLVDTEKYYEFTITGDTGFSISNPTINYGVGRSATGPRLFQWRSSVDSFNSLIPITANNAAVTATAGVIETPDANSGYTGNTVSLTSTGQSTITFRFYVYGAESATGTGGLQGNLTFNGTLVSTTTPTIATSATSLSTFGTVNVGSNSTSQNFTVSGSALTDDVLVSASTDYQVSIDNTTFTTSINLTQSSGTLTGQPVTVYVRYSPNSAGINNGLVTLSSSSATSKTVSVNGTGYVPGTPTIITSTTSLTSFGNVNVGNNSLSKNFTVSANDLTTDVLVSASTDFEISLDNVSFSSSTTLSQSSGTITGQPITVFVRFVPTSGGTNNGTISFSSSGAVTQIVSVTGTGVIPPPVITTSVTSLLNFGIVNVGNNSTSQSFTTSATNLTDIVSVVASTDYQVSSDNLTFTSSLSLSNSSGTLTGQPVTIYVRFIPSVNAASTGTVTLSSTGATNKVINVSGTGYIPTPTIFPSVTSLTDYGNVDINTNSSSQNFTVSSVDLEDNVIVTASSDYQVSLDDILYSSGFSLTQTGGILVDQPVTIYVRFTPTTLGLNNGTITFTSLNAATATVNVSATGIIPLIESPVATDATLITSSSFVANWETVPGATTYRLDVSTSPTFEELVPTTDLFISEYIEGSSSNKYIEIYNGTGSDVDLSDYQLKLFANGTSTATNTNTLSGILPNNATVVYQNSLANVYTGAVTNSSAVNYNGDDAIALFKISSNNYVDIFGSIGFDPGSSWTTSGNTTVNKTLVRNSNITSGITVNPATAFPTLGSEWTQFNIDDVSNLGSHSYTVSAPSFVLGYEDLSVNSISQLVSGLDENTTYYYRIRAFDGTASLNSNVIEVTTLISEPTFTSILQDAQVCQDTNATFTITGLLPSTVSKIGYNIDGGTTQYFNNVMSDNLGNASVQLTLSALNFGQNLTVESIERIDLTTVVLSTNFSISLSVQLYSTFYLDADNDGYGNEEIVLMSCSPVEGYVSIAGDCNDSNPAVNPGATEICYDGIDNNCDGTIDEGCTPIVSVVQATQCGITLPNIDSYVYANLVSGTQGYRFRVTDMSTMQVQTIDKALRVFALTQLANYKFDTTYQIEVSVRKFNVWQPFYGSACTVSTPATTTQVQSSQCGSTLTAMSNIIYANNVPFATGYRFKATNLVTNDVQIVDRPIRDFRMNLLVNPAYNTLYSIEVAVRNTDGTYLPYGPICNVTTPTFPTTSLQDSQCNYTASSNTETIYAISYSGASTYRFKFENTGIGYAYTFDRPLRSFTLNTVPGLLPATTYTVKVSIELNGEFGPYGKLCSITTPGGIPARTIENTDTIVFKAMAYPNPYDNAFNLDVTTSTDEVIELRVYDMIGKLIEARKVDVSSINTVQIGERYPSGVYNVIVSQGNQSQNVRVIKR